MTPDIIECIHDPAIFRPLFKNLDTWRNWIMVLKAMDGLLMTEEELQTFAELTGRTKAPTEPVEETWFIKGRRAGGSFIVALKGVHLACFRNYKLFLGPGERGVIMIVATDRRQSRVILRYIVAILESVPMLAAMITRQDSESIDLNNGISIEIMTGNVRTIRGRTVVAFFGDETSFWRDEESANPAEEILSAVRPAMATIPHARLICIGSPYRRSGVMYEMYRRHFGQDDSRILVLRADTRTMNPTVSQSIIDEAMERDPAAAQAEWFAQFRSDVGSFLDLDLIERAVEVGRKERAPLRGVSYQAFTDPSGGAHDAFTLAIAHRDQERVVLDACRGIRPPFDPSSVVKEFCDLLKSYQCHSVVGDRYSGEWVVESFSKHGITYQHSERSKSEIYLEALPLFSQGCVDLLDYQPLLTELAQLERRTSRSGRDSVDHPPQGHDDLANSCCGALALLTKPVAELRIVKIGGTAYSSGVDQEERALTCEALARGIPRERLRAQRDAEIEAELRRMRQ